MVGAVARWSEWCLAPPQRSTSSSPHRQSGSARGRVVCIACQRTACSWHRHSSRDVTGHPSSAGFAEVAGSEEMLQVAPDGAMAVCVRQDWWNAPGESLLPALLPMAMTAAPSDVVSPRWGHHCGVSMPDAWGVSG
jgi:hypothetical protein